METVRSAPIDLSMYPGTWCGLVLEPRHHCALGRRRHRRPRPRRWPCTPPPPTKYTNASPPRKSTTKIRRILCSMQCAQRRFYRVALTLQAAEFLGAAAELRQLHPCRPRCKVGTLVVVMVGQPAGVLAGQPIRHSGVAIPNFIAAHTFIAHPCMFARQ
eukprot:COSAG05_NODE_712_length_7820_cov_2.834089_2_plen_159_part_00